MEHDAFVGGIKRGGLTSSFEVKILICYMIHTLDVPVTFDELYEAISENVNYFEYVSAVSELSAAGSLILENIQEGKGTFKLTEAGVRTALEFKSSVPLTVRERTMDTAEKTIRARKLEEENTVSYVKVDDGFMLTMTVKDIGSDLLTLTVFLPTEKECIQTRQRFQEDPLRIYQGVIGLLLGEI